MKLWCSHGCASPEVHHMGMQLGMAVVQVAAAAAVPCPACQPCPARDPQRVQGLARQQRVMALMRTCKRV